MQNLLATNNSQAEAKAWISNKDGKERTIGDSSDNLDPGDSKKLVDDLYRGGAIRVTAIDIERETYLETTETLIVELPTDKRLRAQIFGLVTPIAVKCGFDPDVDTGQRFIMLHW